MCTVSEIFSVKEWRDLEIGGRGLSRSLKMALFDRSYTTFLLVGHGKYSCMLYHFQVIWRWIIMTLKSSLKVIQTGTIRKLAYGFLFAFHGNYGRIDNRLWDIQRQSLVWPWKLDLEHDPENWVRGCLRLLKTATFDRSHTSFYWSVIVNIALSCTVFELFDIEWYHDLEISVRGNSRSFKPVPFESWGAVSCAPFIVTMAVSCIICEKKRDIGRTLYFFIPPCIPRPH